MDTSWFKTRLKKIGKTQADLAQYLDIKPSSVSRMFKGSRQMRSSEIGAVANFISASIGEVMQHAGIAQSQNVMAFNNTNTLREEAATFGTPLDNQISIEEVGDFTSDNSQSRGHWIMPQDFVNNRTDSATEKLFMMTIRDDGMTPTLAIGSKILVDTSNTTPNPPGIFLVADDIGYRIRRLEMLPESQVKISTDNTNYTTQTCSLDQLKIKGRVVAHFSYV